MTARVAAEHGAVKRICLPVTAGDGVRVLADRPWQRGVSKAGAAPDAWNRDVVLREVLPDGSGGRAGRGAMQSMIEETMR
ncbi:DUF488 family protein, N3 subclade [Geminicoccus harenae]|uniref:DUF488 family protein, N3 subclade n=1 Tax=Geminicoccus harenae TaxID=2498453 RepID=UPI001C9445D9|nr:hypothetical protein [Geminicoccus harenae]